ncbi:hypothetical protein [Oceanobacter antarcticus]|uniref:Uncharacterized protein n=1 Tax=Oceanobacter antarcticus TaxID=3133425 RepID=A0ABW8NEU8_9GAMM
MITQLLKRAPALVLLLGGIVLLQTHAIDYWSRFDAATGWLWSLVIEGAAIWLWAARSWLKNSIAVFATLLALSAPLYQLAAPVMAEQRSNEQAASTLPDRQQAITAQIASLESSLATYNQNSQTRGGWAARIDTAQHQLASARADLAALHTEQATAQPADWQAWLQIATQGMALIIIQCLVVLTTRTVFAPLAATSQGTQTAAPAAEAGNGAGSVRASHPKLHPVKPSAVSTGLNPAAA